MTQHTFQMNTENRGSRTEFRPSTRSRLWLKFSIGGDKYEVNVLAMKDS